KVWSASGHVDSFSDPLTECKSCHKRFRADHLQEEGITQCPECKGELTEPKQFNLMFKTHAGPTEDDTSTVYLRPETAQGIFVNFDNVQKAMRAKVPFGIAQIGKAFRNEITFRNFIFRVREFEQMELEFFVKPGTDDEWFNYWRTFCMDFLINDIGLKKEHLHFRDHEKAELSHYSKATTDIEFEYPFGTKELWGIANRQAFDLTQHGKFSGQPLEYLDPETGEKYIPFVIEPSVGVSRLMLAALLDAYTIIEGGRSTTTSANKEEEVVLKFHPSIAPVKVAVFPLSKKEPLTHIARDICATLRKQWVVQYDESGSIGRRYRRQDEIGTPFCITVDFDSVEDKKVTVRHRDTMEQERVSINELESYIEAGLENF
ncbi:MAG TPA: glycine--tRNA ligase, partial [Patescibacteria group bacterium]|nr:glycine--tRNA ligase [Patescibacteria group bacterium]